jgi:hypothetical protein
VEGRLLKASKAKDLPREWQYAFEESCCKAMYNATTPRDEFDPSSPFFVAGEAIGLARSVGIEVEQVANVLCPPDESQIQAD